VRADPPAVTAAALPPAAKRLIVYAATPRKGRVHEHVFFALDALRPHAERLVVVIDGDADDIPRLETIADVVVASGPAGGAGAHSRGWASAGMEGDDVDEVLLVDDSWFGPVHPLAAVLGRMGSRPVDFWTMFDEDEPERDARGDRGPSWFAARRAVLASPHWRRFWEERREPGSHPEQRSAASAIVRVLRAAGFASEAAFPSSRYGVADPARFSPDALLDDGCPIIDRALFATPPEALSRHAVNGREVIAHAEHAGFPAALVWPPLVTGIPPRVLYTNAAMLEVLSHSGPRDDAGRALRVLVALHIFYPEMTGELMARVARLPAGYHVIITTPDQQRAERIRAELDASGLSGAAEVRVVASNNGRDQSAFLIGCRDELLGDDYDVVVKLHSKSSPQDLPGVARHFRDQLLDNLLPSPGYAAEALALFQREPGLGIVHPPMFHLGYPTMGHAWWANRPGVQRLCAMLDITVPLDEGSPVAPYGSMFMARPAALRTLVEHPWTYAEFGDARAYEDGGLAHVLERMPVLAAAERGYHARAIVSPEYAAVSHTSLEYRLDAVSSSLPGDGSEAIEYMRSVGPVGSGRRRDFIRMYLRRRHPRLAARLRGWGLPL